MTSTAGGQKVDPLPEGSEELLAPPPPSAAAVESLTSRIVLTLATSGLIVGLNVLGGVLSARTLGVDGRGLLAAITLWPVAIAYVGDLGVPLALAYFSASEKKLRPDLLSTALALGLLQSIVMAGSGIVIVALTLGPRYGASTVLLAAAFIVAWTPVNLLNRYPNAINQGSQRFRSYNLIRMTVTVVYVTGCLICFAFGLHRVEFFLVATWAATAAAATFALRRVEGGFRLSGFQPALARRILSYGLKAHIGNIAPIDVLQLDLLAVVVLIGAEASGLYAVASSAASVLQTAAVALGIVAMPALAAATVQDQGRLAGIFMKAALLLVGGAGLV